MRTGFAPVSHSISFDPQKISKGKALALFHVRRVEELPGIGDGRLVRGSCVRTTNINEHPYKVALEVSCNNI